VGDISPDCKWLTVSAGMIETVGDRIWTPPRHRLKLSKPWQPRRSIPVSWLPFLLDLSANPKALPLGFHRAHLSLRDQKNNINET